MARTVLPATKRPGAYATTLTPVVFTACDVPNGNSYPYSGDELILVKNTGGAPYTLTIASVQDSKGRVGDIAAQTIAAGAEVVLQNFPVEGWLQADGTLWINGSNALLLIAVISQV